MKIPPPDFNRIRAALTRNSLPDRVPIAEGCIDTEVMQAFLGKPIHRAADVVQFWRGAGYDYALFQVRGQPLPDSEQVKLTEGIHRPHSRQAQSTGTSGMITGWKEFETYPWIDIRGVYFKDVEQAEACPLGGMKLIINVGPIFSGIWRSMGLECFSVACLDAPDLVRAVAEKMGVLTVTIVEDLVQRETVGGIWLGDDLAYTNGLMVSPQFLRSHVFPHYTEISRLCSRYDKLFIHHSDGDKSEVLQDLVDCGIHAIHPNEPTSVDIVQVKREWGGNLALVGNIDMDALIRGTPLQIEKLVEQLIEHVAGDGGLAVGSSNSVSADVPLSNYKAMIDAVRKYGNIYR